MKMLSSISDLFEPTELTAWLSHWSFGWIPRLAFCASAISFLLGVLLLLLNIRMRREEVRTTGFLGYLCLFTGVTATSLVVTHTVTETGTRFIHPYTFGNATDAVPIAITIGLLILAAIAGGRATRTTLAPAWILALFGMFALHLSVSYGAPGTTLRNPANFVAGDALPLPWTLVFQLAIAGLLTSAACVKDIIYRRRRARAWPDRLDELLTSYLTWPGYASVESVIAAGVLILGVYHLVLADTQTTLPLALNGASTLAGALTCLFMAYRRWNGNTAMLGMTLLSLTFVLMALTIAGVFIVDAVTTPYARRMATLLNVILYALWLIVALWLWLAVFWDQQLLNGRGWTTTGKMIPYANALALYLLLVGVICAFQMTLWAINPGIPPNNYSMVKLLVGGGGIFVLMIPALRMGIAKRNVAFASIACALAVALFAFLAIRWPQPEVRGFLRQYAPVVTGVACIFLILVAEALDRKEGGRAFATPIWFLSLLFLPVVAISNLISTNRLAESWIQAGTMLPLALTYSIAGLREHRRSFVVLAAVLLLAAFSA